MMEYRRNLESAGEAAEILRREAAEYADLARRLEDLTATRSEAPLLWGQAQA